MSPEETYRQRMEQINDDHQKEVDRIYREYHQRMEDIDAYYTPRIRACNVVLGTLGAALAFLMGFILCTLL